MCLKKELCFVLFCNSLLCSLIVVLAHQIGFLTLSVTAFDCLCEQTTQRQNYSEMIWMAQGILNYS